VNSNFHPRGPVPVWLGHASPPDGEAVPTAAAGALDRAERWWNYLQRVFGYALTGVTWEKAVFVFYGSGNNGKTTILATIRQLIEEYSHSFRRTRHDEVQNNNPKPTWPDLRGARFVRRQTEEGHRFAQGN